jgi:hypothetical protein
VKEGRTPAAKPGQPPFLAPWPGNIQKNAKKEYLMHHEQALLTFNLKLLGFSTIKRSSAKKNCLNGLQGCANRGKLFLLFPSSLDPKNHMPSANFI